MYFRPKLCMLIHVNVGTFLDVRSEMNIHFTGVNEGCKVCCLGSLPYHVDQLSSMKTEMLNARAFNIRKNMITSIHYYITRPILLFVIYSLVYCNKHYSGELIPRCNNKTIRFLTLFSLPLYVKQLSCDNMNVIETIYIKEY